ncbi:hypothetical protein [Salmonella phage PT1]|nr:hypothetical protein [Salmonella phage PT1]
MSADVSELNRQLNNVVRIGTIKQLDLANARAKVSVAGCTTDWLPWGTNRAGKRRDWSPPVIGEQVVLFAPYGDLGQAVIGPSIFQDDHAAPAASADQETTVYPDGTTVDYNSASNTLTITVAGSGNVIINCKVATVKAETSVTLDTPDTVCTGNLTVAKSFQMGQEGGSATMKGNVAIEGGSLTHNGKNVGSTHSHSGVTPGGGNTGAPV